MGSRRGAALSPAVDLAAGRRRGGTIHGTPAHDTSVPRRLAGARRRAGARDLGRSEGRSGAKRRGAVRCVFLLWRARGRCASELVLRPIPIALQRLGRRPDRSGAWAADEPQLHPPGWRRRRPARRLAGTTCSSCASRSSRAWPSTTRLLTENPIWRERTVGVGVITTAGGARAQRDRSDPAVDRLRVGPAQGAAVPRVRRRRLRRDLHGERRRVRPLPDPPLRDPRVDQDRAPVRRAHAAAATTACRTARSRRRRERGSTSRWRR